MRGLSFVSGIAAVGLALVLAELAPVAVAAEDVATAERPASALVATNPQPNSTPPSSAAAAPSPSRPDASASGAATPSSQSTAASPMDATDPIIASIRSNLGGAPLRRGADLKDLAALEAFYAERSDPPVWITGMGFSAKAQAAVNEIGKADDWGLTASAFELPPAGDLPDSAADQASAEIKLQLAILKYARFARGGRVDPSSLSVLIDQAPPLLDPKIVLTEIAASSAPDTYLQSLHPKHEQFQRLRQALLRARETAKKPRNEQEIQRLLVNMERWRWMPADLGAIYVQDNIPEFMLFVVKNGKTIHSDKIAVGELRYATPVFSANMQAIVFNPEWTAPPSVVREDLLPNLRSGGWFGGSSILRQHGLQVKYNGRTVDPGSINWNSVNTANIAFTQPPGPRNVLGKVKFLYPNKHVVYMHDTIRPDVFKPTVRAIGHNCIRMEKPSRLAEVLLKEDKGWDAQRVEDLIDKGYDSAVNLDHPVPVHTTYFTAVVNDQGKVSTFADLYGLDRKIAPVVVKVVASVAPAGSDEEASNAARAAKPKATKENMAGSIQGLFGN